MLSKTWTSAKMSDSTVIQKARTPLHDGHSHEGKGGLLRNESVRTEAAGQTLLGCSLCG